MSDKKEKKKGEGKKKWKCKKHKVAKHDIFINYRVKSDKDLALKLFYALSAETKTDGKAIRAYLDAQCLNDGEEWETGFLNGLEHSAVLLLLISEDGLEGVKDAHKWQDNVLLEYEYALEKHEKGTAVLLPLLVGKNVDGGLYKPFGAFGVSQYSDQKHASAKSTKPVRETMEKLFKLQGLKTDPNSLGDRIKDIVGKAEEALKKYGRLGEAKSEETYGDKWVSTWTAKDVQHYLKDAGLEEFQDAFKKNAVDGTLFLQLDEKMLTEELGITKKLHIVKLLAFIEKSKKEEEEEEDEEEEDDDEEGGDDEDEGSSKKSKKKKDDEDEGDEEE